MQNRFDRVLMPLPERAYEYLDYALFALKPEGGWIHYYDFEYSKNNKGGILKIKLINKINKINSIRPRYSCTIDQIESFEKVYLPATGFGIIIISTSKGLMTHYEAKEKKIGGSLIAFCY